jgi:signal transduction histidine kinase/ActR/RegA family two-component response regulator
MISEGYVRHAKLGEAYILGVATPLYDPAGTLIGVIESIRDITERKKMEKDLLRSQKIESIGLFAGGIAHDFNNLLTAVLGNISLARISPHDKVGNYLDAAEKASMRASDLTKRLITFARGGDPVMKAVSLSEVIKMYTGLALSGSKNSCAFSIPGDLWSVHADEGQIGQVITNLVINADQAMPDGGSIRVICSNITLNEDDSLSLKKGRYVSVSIQDQGIGVPEESIGKIFDPYFTTKATGAGLGLATAYSIIKKHGGHIAVESSVGKGSTFTFYLPVSQSLVSAPHPEEVKIPSGKGNILVMDDEESVRDVLGAMLLHFGYTAEFAKDGTEAIDRYANAMKSVKPFDAVIMDLTIPGGMGGKEAVKKLIQIDPNIKAIVSSGYSHDPILSDFKTYGFSGVITKPYRINELSEQLIKVLQEKTA